MERVSFGSNSLRLNTKLDTKALIVLQYMFVMRWSVSYSDQTRLG